ncbi:threonine-phosphate decarboxylase CobD [Deefgea salmonis]|uniref:Putative 8-amino-7-oxononanoate synthase n=1 Tax=Deefgea salmonis TaxID=2875502 RepID=A0ABS8BHB3_9NEIS|nr:threonine-phosphate decarboxylase CobD [Deefgea salmonis]MCB5195105.1 threonine-phosphate decarboxylase CobD [Deefgea salmonis]
MADFKQGRPCHAAPRHGGNLLAVQARFGGGDADWLDCSTGISPYSYPLPAMPESVAQRLPQISAEFGVVLKQYYGSAQCLPVAGSQAAIVALPQLRAPCRVGVLRLSYAEHAWRWQLAGHVMCVLARDEIDAALDTLDVLILVNPNNPDGHCWTAQQLLAMHARLAARGAWLIVDEAFIDVDAAESVCQAASQPHRSGLIVLRGIGKFFGLAGLRLGLVFTDQAILAALAQIIGPWSVSGPALWAGQLALADVAWQQLQKTCLQQAGQAMRAQLMTHGLIPSSEHPLMQFCVVDQIDQWGYALAANGIYARVFNTQDVGVNALRFGALTLQQQAQFAQRLARAAAQAQST